MRMEIAYSYNIFNYGMEDKRKKMRVVYSFLEARLLVKLLRINSKILRHHFDRDELTSHWIPPLDEC
ncbi:MAG: hypothetical protein U9O90_04765 [Euryarchaeota archaeon]|nr:hypothetical protein [Euryarchaeota archaeon]